MLGVDADNLSDARAFVELSRAFRAADVNVPLALAHSSDFSHYLVEDLGDNSLFGMLPGGNCGGAVEAALRELVRLQTVPESNWKNLVAYPPFNRRQVMWDLNYFKYEFVKSANAPFDESLLEDDFEALAKELTDLPDSLYGFMMRDCQSRNVIMVSGDSATPEPYFIDFQGGRKGPCLYDAVSFLWQAKAGFANSFRMSMMEAYASEFSRLTGVDKDEIMSRVGLFALFRTLQVLGAYGYRGLIQKRAHFIESIPAALTNLSQLIEEGNLDRYPELRRVCSWLVADRRFAPVNDDRLRIKVFSFSYKRGYPEDLSGNGGGFMFDCRGMHNPGRYAEYKPLTGLDQPVIDFLKECGEIDLFVDKAVDIVSPSVECYLRRGFKSLQIGFGCTGGRHRSVYSAQAMAERLAEKYPAAIVELCHREQNILTIYNDKNN